MGRDQGQGADPVARRAVPRDRDRLRADPGDHVVHRAAVAGEGQPRLPPGQLVSGGFVAFTHGTNDAQKTMGIIALALVASGHLEPGLRAAADLGDRLARRSRWARAPTRAAGGSSRRSGSASRRSTRRRASPRRPRAPRSSGATAHLGFPVSTTHMISGSVLGAGAIRGFHAVRWGVAGNILVAWILTHPRGGARRRRHGGRHAPAGGRRDRVRARDRDRGVRRSSPGGGNGAASLPRRPRRRPSRLTPPQLPPRRRCFRPAKIFARMFITSTNAIRTSAAAQARRLIVRVGRLREREDRHRQRRQRVVDVGTRSRWRRSTT